MVLSLLPLIVVFAYSPNVSNFFDFIDGTMDEGIELTASMATEGSEERLNYQIDQDYMISSYGVNEDGSFMTNSEGEYYPMLIMAPLEERQLMILLSRNQYIHIENIYEKVFSGYLLSFPALNSYVDSIGEGEIATLLPYILDCREESLEADVEQVRMDMRFLVRFSPFVLLFLLSILYMLVPNIHPMCRRLAKYGSLRVLKIAVDQDLQLPYLDINRRRYRMTITSQFMMLYTGIGPVIIPIEHVKELKIINKSNSGSIIIVDSRGKEIRTNAKYGKEDINRFLEQLKQHTLASKLLISFPEEENNFWES